MRLIRPYTAAKIVRANRLNANEPRTVTFVTQLLRAREIKMATALRKIGWKVILLYVQTTPFEPSRHFDIAIKLRNTELLHRVALSLQPRLCHVFSGAVDDNVLRFCRHKPGPVVIDLNDVFCPSLFNYLQERFEPTRECLSLADGLVCRDLQPKYAERVDGFAIPRHILLFPEYSWIDGPADPKAAKKLDPDEVHVVSVGTFTLETEGMFDSAYLQLAKMLTSQKIHFHIYPHWFYRQTKGSVFRFNQRDAFRQFYELQDETSYLHMHDSLPVDKLAHELPQYDFGLVSGGSEKFGQKLEFLNENYMKACYSGRIADYLDARLPVVINPEVKFNFRLLARHGIVVDLDGLLKDGFRDELLKLKRDPQMRHNVEQAAASLDLHSHAARLAAFYETVASEAPAVMRFPMWLKAATRAPVLGPRLRVLRDAAAKVPSLTDSVERLAREGERLAAQNSAQASTIATLNAQLKALTKRQDQLAERNESLLDKLEEWSAIRRRQPSLADFHDLPTLAADPALGADEIAGLLNWREIIDDVERQNGFNELIRTILLFSGRGRKSGSKSARMLSFAWQLLNQKNLDQLLRDGYRNFRRTIALNYFTFPIQANDPQITEVEDLLDNELCAILSDRARDIPDDPEFELEPQEFFRYHTLLLSAYARHVDELKLLDAIEEPDEGNPVVVPFAGRRMSQDLANSTLEYYSIREGRALNGSSRMLEVGGGYGRDAFIFLSAHPGIKYVMVDIPPAIFIAQRYLSAVFRDLPIFRVTDFADFARVEEEIEAASLVFLLPHQLELLPPKYFDIAINISCFGEMNREQIDFYFDQIDRLTKKQFFTKQWCESHNPFDELVLYEDDYPVKPHWKKRYSRPCATNKAFFESIYDIGTED